MSVRRFARLLMLSAAVCAASVPAMAVETGDGEVAAAAYGKPLIIIRFNQSRVVYERQLFAVAQRATQIKPGVVFDIIAYVPAEGGDASGGARVVNSLRGMGVPSDRIAYREVPSTGISSTEVHVFVR